MIAKLIVVSPENFDSWLKGGKISLEGQASELNMPAGEKLLFERGCTSCHSVEGGAMMGPTFKGLFGARVRVMTAGRMRTVMADGDYIRKSILDPAADVVDGFPGTMPSARDVLSDAEIGVIVSYLKTLK